MVKKGNYWALIGSTLPNRFVKGLFTNSELSMFAKCKLVRTEIQVHRHRFDFLLERDGKPVYLEVKSVTLVIEGIAMFPDAVTERGKKHVEFLGELSSSEIETGILFVCQRPDVYLFKPEWNRDPIFAQALVDAHKKGVGIWVATTEITPSEINLKEQIPYDLTPF